eukprot:2063828-Rhodomonas_salina.1
MLPGTCEKTKVNRVGSARATLKFASGMRVNARNGSYRTKAGGPVDVSITFQLSRAALQTKLQTNKFGWSQC